MTVLRALAGVSGVSLAVVLAQAITLDASVVGQVLVGATTIVVGAYSYRASRQAQRATSDLEHRKADQAELVTNREEVRTLKAELGVERAQRIAWEDWAIEVRRICAEHGITVPAPPSRGES